jgi:hypothetical protein
LQAYGPDEIVALASLSFSVAIEALYEDVTLPFNAAAD